MERFRRYFKREMDVEFLACVHGMSLVFIYGMMLYFEGHVDVPYVIIFEMFVAGYAISWTQKLLFLKDRSYGKYEYRIRAALWCVLPNVECFIAGRIFNWYTDLLILSEVIFYGLMLCYYMIIFWCVRTFYREETREMNQLLTEYKRREQSYETDHTGK